MNAESRSGWRRRRERKKRSWETERRAEGRRREIGADGMDGRGRAMNEMRLRRRRRKPSASTAAELADGVKENPGTCLRKA
jgi:hypothetical protein